jgi:predicted nucleic acid-binding protein
MDVERFLDTNVLFYGYDLDAPGRRAIAQRLIEEAWLRPGCTAISVQVLQEFHVHFMRKGHSRGGEAHAVAGDFSLWPIVDNTMAVFRLGLSSKERWQLSLWDAMIVAAAQTSGALELLTEDLSHRHEFGKVRVVNPFAG